MNQRKWLFIVVLFLVIGMVGCQKQVPLPKGFHIVQQDTNRIIADEEGNEFVWIPANTVSRYDFVTKQEVKKNEAIDRIFYGEERKESVVYDTEYALEVFEKSVLEEGGFYISRYLISGNQDHLQSIANQDPMIFITRDEALELCQSYLTEDGWNATLPYSYAYDTIFRLIDENALENYEQIGVLSEWSSEYSSNAYYDYVEDCVSRGSNASDSYSTISLRKQNSSDAANEFTGFRILLYRK